MYKLYSFDHGAKSENKEIMEAVSTGELKPVILRIVFKIDQLKIE